MSTFIKLAEFLVDRRADLMIALWEHMMLTIVPITFAVIVSIPLGILATRYSAIEAPIMETAGIMQTIPSLALLAVMIPLFGIGRLPAYVALFLYALLPILRNTYAGISGVNKSIKQAAVGMGMTDLQVLLKIELPLAFPVIMAGIRTATVIVVGTAVLAAYVGGGGLGKFIVMGLGLARDYLILAGAIPSAILALLVDLILHKLQYRATPKGLRI